MLLGPVPPQLAEAQRVPGPTGCHIAVAPEGCPMRQKLVKVAGVTTAAVAPLRWDTCASAACRRLLGT